MVAWLHCCMVGQTPEVNWLPEKLRTPKGAAARALSESSVRSAMFIARRHTGRQAPLGAACHPPNRVNPLCRS